MLANQNQLELSQQEWLNQSNSNLAVLSMKKYEEETKNWSM